MSFLARIRSHLRAGVEVTLRLRKEEQGTRITLIPKVDAFDPDTSDPVESAYQAAMARPLTFIVSDEADLDAATADKLVAMSTGIATTVDELEAYKASVQADLEAARKAADEKRAKAKTKAKPTTKAAGAKAACSPAEAEPPKAPDSIADLFSPQATTATPSPAETVAEPPATSAESAAESAAAPALSE